MTRDERRALLGDDVLARLRERVALAPEPTDDLVADLRLIMTRPGGRIPQARPAADAA
ncbi:hypothetical protein ACH4ZX_03575 [Streptomyces sp. NPDC020490]|uniref:hypothetical protein n=1 Tax=Streptomyces sp. NPDC020490 TaxID=3365078 RepID=UPI00378A55B8